MKCLHYHICIRKENLCNDSKCKLNRIIQDKEIEKNRQECREFLDEYKKSLGINSFLDLNI
jgi:hypothetical protein